MKKQKLLLVIVLLGLFPVLHASVPDVLPLPVTDISQQSRKITGVVVDDFGDPIIGANVIEKGTTNGTMTDLDGNFSLDVSSNAAILAISYIGYISQEITVGNQSVLSITLNEDTQRLDEVVVVGFGTQKKVNLTGAVGTVNADALASRPVTNASQALQGLVPGLNISSASGSLEKTADISIRGTGTIGDGSSGSPLILIDGMEGDINTINPQDIENISILKDAAASSIYGSRAPFGVILITTKSGRTGKPVVNYNNSFRWNAPVLRPQMMDSYTFATYFNDAQYNGGNGVFFDADHMQRIIDYQKGTLKKSIPDNGNGYWEDGYGYGNDNVDWYDALYKNWQFSTEHNFSVSGGTDAVNYYFSANYMTQDGLMRFNTDTYDRYTLTGKIGVKLTDWAKLNYNSRFTRSDYGRPADLTDDLYSDLARQGWPTLPLYDPNGYFYSSPSPALNLAEGGRDTKQTDNIYQQVGLILEPVKNWITHVDFNYRVLSANRHWHQLQTYNHDVNGDPYLWRTGSNVHEDQEKQNYMNFNAYSEYSFGLESGHNFKVMGGFQAETMRKTAFGLQRNGIIVADYPVVDLTSGLDYNGNEVTPSTNGEYQRWQTAGFFGRLNYDYKGKYLLEANLRYDGTSRFREEQRWIWSPSFSAGWNIAREEFWEPFVDIIGTFKIRASYGQLANQNTEKWYPTYQTIEVKSSDGSWLQNGAKPNIAKTPGLVSSSLGWEKIRNWNVGLDFGFLNNRLTGSFDYYTRKTIDMIGPAPELPVTLGVDVPKTNNTDLETYGFDLEIAWNDRLRNGMNYSAKLILSDAQTKITRYPNVTGSLDTYVEGRNINEIWGYETVGIARTQAEMDAHLAKVDQSSLGTNWEAGDIMYADLNGDGRVDKGANTISDHGDLKLLGNSTPRYLFGIDLSADWKGFDFRAFFQGVLKRDYWQGSYYFWGATNNIWWSAGLTEHGDYFRDANSWSVQEGHQGVNLNSYYPRPNFSSGKNQEKQSGYLQNASYIRLKNLQVGYTLPQEITNKMMLQRVRFFISGENLWTGTKMKSMFDPETVSGGKDKNGNAYPLSKTISFGLSLTL